MAEKKQGSLVGDSTKKPKEQVVKGVYRDEFAGKGGSYLVVNGKRVVNNGNLKGGDHE